MIERICDFCFYSNKCGPICLIFKICSIPVQIIVYHLLNPVLIIAFNYNQEITSFTNCPNQDNDSLIGFSNIALRTMDSNRLAKNFTIRLNLDALESALFFFKRVILFLPALFFFESFFFFIPRALKIFAFECAASRCETEKSLR